MRVLEFKVCRQPMRQASAVNTTDLEMLCRHLLGLHVSFVSWQYNVTRDDLEMISNGCIATYCFHLLGRIHSPREKHPDRPNTFNKT